MMADAGNHHACTLPRAISLGLDHHHAAVLGASRIVVIDGDGGHQPGASRHEPVAGDTIVWPISGGEVSQLLALRLPD